MLCPACSYNPECSCCQGLNNYWPGLPTCGEVARSAGGDSNFGGQLRVLLFADQVLELAGILEADAQQPSGAIRLAVDHVRGLECLAVDLEDLTGHRRLQGRRGFFRFDMAHALVCVQDVTEVGQLERGDLPHLVLKVVTQAEDCL